MRHEVVPSTLKHAYPLDQVHINTLGFPQQAWTKYFPNYDQ